MTPREIRHEVASVRSRTRDERKRDIALAWRVASYATAAFVNKLQPLSTLLADAPEASSDLTEQGLAEAMRVIGIPSRPVTEEARKSMRFRES